MRRVDLEIIEIIMMPGPLVAARVFEGEPGTRFDDGERHDLRPFDRGL